MDIKQIQELVKLINKTNIGEITIEEEGTKITIKQKKDPVQHIVANVPSGGNYAPAAQPAAAPASAPPAAAPAAVKEDKFCYYQKAR